MIIAFQILVLLIMVVSFISIFADYDNKDFNNAMAFVCVGSMIGFCISIIFF